MRVQDSNSKPKPKKWAKIKHYPLTRNTQYKRFQIGECGGKLEFVVSHFSIRVLRGKASFPTASLSLSSFAHRSREPLAHDLVIMPLLQNQFPNLHLGGKVLEMVVSSVRPLDLTYLRKRKRAQNLNPTLNPTMSWPI